MPNLPDKPSELIRVAMADLAKCEADERYQIDMGFWHRPYAGKCSVCLAGAVMAMSLDADPSESVYALDIACRGYPRKLLALDRFRAGDVAEGLRYLGEDSEKIRAYRDIATYSDGGDKFRADMNQLADDLEEVGL